MLPYWFSDNRIRHALGEEFPELQINGRYIVVPAHQKEELLNSLAKLERVCLKEGVRRGIVWDPEIEQRGRSAEAGTGAGGGAIVSGGAGGAPPGAGGMIEPPGTQTSAGDSVNLSVHMTTPQPENILDLGLNLFLLAVRKKRFAVSRLPTLYQRHFGHAFPRQQFFQVRSKNDTRTVGEDDVEENGHVPLSAVFDQLCSAVARKVRRVQSKIAVGRCLRTTYWSSVMHSRSFQDHFWYIISLLVSFD